VLPGLFTHGVGQPGCTRVSAGVWVWCVFLQRPANLAAGGPAGGRQAPATSRVCADGCWVLR
jgi:hypothetical protein